MYNSLVMKKLKEKLKKLSSSERILKSNMKDMDNSQIVIALLDIMSDFRDVIDENRQEEAERLFKIAYELIFSID